MPIKGFRGEDNYFITWDFFSYVSVVIFRGEDNENMWSFNKLSLKEVLETTFQKGIQGAII